MSNAYGMDAAIQHTPEIDPTRRFAPTGPSFPFNRPPIAADEPPRLLVVAASDVAPPLGCVDASRATAQDAAADSPPAATPTPATDVASDPSAADDAQASPGEPWRGPGGVSMRRGLSHA